MKGDYARAATVYEETLVLFQALEQPTGIAVTLHNLGHCVLRQGNPWRAMRLFQESLSLLRDLQEQYIVATCLAGLGSACLALDWPRRAIRLFGAVAAALSVLGTQLEPVDRVEYESARDSARAALDPAAWDQEWTTGQKMTLEEALAYALAVGPE